jgi:LuxR family maltose regulon positive regulatory protein
LSDRDYRMAHANTLAVSRSTGAQPRRQRQLEAPSLADAGPGPQRLAYGIGLGLVRISHLWDGNPVKAESCCVIRWNVPSATPGAAASWRRSWRRYWPPRSASVVTRHSRRRCSQTGWTSSSAPACPDAIVLAYRTLASVAQSQGDEQRALDVLDSLHAFGKTARMPRLVMTSLARADQDPCVALAHGSRRRARCGWTAWRPCSEPDYAVFRPLYELKAATANPMRLWRTERSGRRQRLPQARRFTRSPAQLRARGADDKVLRAVVAHQRGDVKALALLSEATSLAAIGGIERLLAETPMAETMAKMGRSRCRHVAACRSQARRGCARCVRPGPSALAPRSRYRWAAC